MSQLFYPWICDKPLFFSFFQEHPLALKSLSCSLLGISENRVLACYLPLPHKSSPVPEFKSLNVILQLSGPATLHLDILLSPPRNGTRPSPRLFNLQPPDFFPLHPHIRVSLLAQADDKSNPCFYGEFPSSDSLEAERVLNLSYLGLSDSSTRRSRLYGFSKLLLVRFARELPELSSSYPELSQIASLLGDYLSEQELSSCFREGLTASHIPGLGLMCSLNRKLLRENRIEELKKASQDSRYLEALLTQYHLL